MQVRDTERRRDIERRNVVCNAVGEGFWGLGLGLAAPLTVLPLLVAALGGKAIEVGLVATIAGAGILVPQILSSLVLQRGEGRRRFLVFWHWACVIPPWFGIGLVVMFVGPARPVIARALILVFYALFMLAVGFIMPAWSDWVASMFRPENRGRVYSWSNASMAACSALGALLAGVITGALGLFNGYATLFLIGGALFIVGMVPFLLISDHPSGSPPLRMSARELFRRFGLSLRDGNFRRYLVARLLLTAGWGPAAFFAVHYRSLDGGGLRDGTIILLGSVIMAVQAAAGFGLGRIGDTAGHKRGSVIGAMSQAASLVILLSWPGAWSCAIVFALVGVGLASAWISDQNLLFETCPHDCRMAHITVSNLVLAPVTAVIPVATGKAVAVWGMAPVVRICLFICILGLAWLLTMVKEPRALTLSEQISD